MPLNPVDVSIEDMRHISPQSPMKDDIGDLEADLVAAFHTATPHVTPLEGYTDSKDTDQAPPVTNKRVIAVDFVSLEQRLRQLSDG